MSEMNTKSKIGDFGEKIGGARKDIYMRRGGLSVSDLDEMNDREIPKNVKKDTVWCKPDFVNMVDKEGYSPFCAYYIKTLRDSLPAKPWNTGKANAIAYIELIELYKEVALTLKQDADLYDVWSKVRKEGEKRGNRHYNSRSFIKTIDVAKMSLADQTQLMVEAKVQNFPYDFNGKLKGLGVKPYNTFVNGNKVLCYRIVKNNRGVSGYTKYYSSIDEAMKVLIGEVVPKILNTEEKKKEVRVKKVVRPQLEGISRVGVDVIKGRKISGEHLLDEFGFRGGEFGNWNNEKDRQAFLDYSYVAFRDLADVMGVNPLFLSLGVDFSGVEKKLAIAFGARGQGGALAHYEPSNTVINLTKLKGAGSLAHEWGHALDDYIGNKLGLKGLYSETYSPWRKCELYTEVNSLFIELIDTMMSKPLSDDEVLEHRKEQLGKEIKRAESWLRTYTTPTIRRTVTEEVDGKKKKVKKWESANTEEQAQLQEAKDLFLSRVDTDTLENLSVVYKKLTGVLPSKDMRDGLAFSVRMCINYRENIELQEKEGVIENRPKKGTEYLENARTLDKYRDKPYFATKVELFARAFESYVEDMITKKGCKSDYLVHATQNSYYDGMNPYPSGYERQLINSKMEKLLSCIVATFSVEVPRLEGEYIVEEDGVRKGCITEEKEVVDSTVDKEKILCLEDALKIAKSMELGAYQKLRDYAIIGDFWLDKCIDGGYNMEAISLCEFMLKEKEENNKLINFPYEWEGVVFTDLTLEEAITLAKKEPLHKYRMLRRLCINSDWLDKARQRNIPKEILDLCNFMHNEYSSNNEYINFPPNWLTDTEVREKELMGDYTENGVVGNNINTYLDCVYKNGMEIKGVKKIEETEIKERYIVRFKNSHIMEVDLRVSLKDEGRYVYQLKLVDNPKKLIKFGECLSMKELAKETIKVNRLYK